MEELPVILILTVVVALWIAVIARFVYVAKSCALKKCSASLKSDSHVGAEMAKSNSMVLSPILLCAMFVSIFAALVTVVVF